MPGKGYMSLNRVIAVSVDQFTKEGAMAAAASLRRAGWRTQLFLNMGDDESQLEKAILHDVSIQAVLEYSLNDLPARLLGIRPAVQPERLTSAGTVGIPQIVIPGSLDHCIHLERLEVPGKRPSMQLDQSSRLVRTTAEDNDEMGKEIAFKLSASKGPVTILFPQGGISQLDGEGQPFNDPNASRALLDSLLLWKTPSIPLIESHRHINDPLFAQIAVDQMLKLLVVRG
jgi:uncharacterized protein (UPF0261 family)